MTFPILLISVISSYSSACPQAFSSRSHDNSTIQQKLERYKNNPQQDLKHFIESLTPLEIMDNLSVLSPKHAQFFTAEQLKPDYSKISKAVILNNYYLDNPISDENSPKVNRMSHASIQLTRSSVYLPVERVRTLKKDSDFYKAYGPLPHLPPDYIPHLKPSVITELRKSIRYLLDKVQHMTTEQIRALNLDQILILSTKLHNTGKNADLSSQQILTVMRKYPEKFALLRASTHADIVIEELLNKIDDKKFLIGSIPLDIINQIPSHKFYLHFLQILRRKSYSHFLAISPQQINGMRSDLQQYIVTERWKVFLRKPQEKTRFRNLSVEKVKQMSTEDREEVLDKMNLSEENFMHILG